MNHPRHVLLWSLIASIPSCKSTDNLSASKAAPEGSQVPSDYIDPKFEHPWVSSCDANHFDAAACDGTRNLTPEAKEQIEMTEIAKVRGVIENFVAQQAKQRASWRAEYESLKSEFDGKPAPGIFSYPSTQSRYARYKNLERTYNDLPNRPTYATRDVHRKTHGCLAATFKVESSLDPALSKGLFTPSKSYEAIVRYSNGNPKAQSDVTPDARGMAVKILPEGSIHKSSDANAPIEYWLGASNGVGPIDPTAINKAGLLDILTINFPVFFINNPPIYSDVNNAFLHITNNENAFLESKFSDFSAIYAQGMSPWERTLALNVNGSIIYNPLYTKYYSMAPSRLGDAADSERTAVKYIWDPCDQTEGQKVALAKNSPEWTKTNKYAYPLSGSIRELWQGVPSDVSNHRNHLRNMMASTLGNGGSGVCYKLKVQKYLDPQNTPIEDSTAVWLESEQQRSMWQTLESMPTMEAQRVRAAKISPMITVGELTIYPLPKDEIVTDEQGLAATKNNSYCEDLSFNPWNNVPSAHRPLGVVQRMKRQVYDGSRNTRFKTNGVKNPYSE